MGDDETVARLHLVDEVDVVLEDVGEFDREAVGAARGVDRDIERAVHGAAQHPLLGLERVLDDVRAEAVLGAGHRERRRLVDAPRERLDLAVQVRQLDDVARADHVEALADVREAAQFREIRELQLHAAEDLVERVIAADRDGDELEGRGARRHRLGRLDGRQEGVDRRVEQRVLDLRAHRREDRARDDAGRDDAEAVWLRGGDDLGGSFRKEGSGHRGGFRENRGRTVKHGRKAGQPFDWAAFVLRHRYRCNGSRQRLPRHGPAPRIAALPRDSAGKGERCWRLHNNSRNCAAAPPSS